jgi:hypothetical protein
VSRLLEEKSDHVRLPASFNRLERGIPSELLLTARRDDVSVRAALEQDWLAVRPCGIGEGTERPGSSIGLTSRRVNEALKQVIQPVVADGGHEMLDIDPWETVQGVKAECGIFGDAGSAKLEGLCECTS